MKARGFNTPRPKKYRPTKAEQGLFIVRLIGQPLPTAPSPDLKAIHDLSAMKWGASASLPAHQFIKGLKGIQKRNLRRADIGKKSKVLA